MHVASGVVVGIKEVCVLWNFGVISGKEFFQQKCLEKPRCMREMPLRRADVRHRLHDVIFWFETSAERVSEISDFVKTVL